MFVKCNNLDKIPHQINKMDDSTLLDMNIDSNTIAYSSSPDSKISKHASIKLFPGVYHQIEGIELDTLQRSVRILLLSIKSLSTKVEQQWLGLKPNSENKKDELSIVLFRGDLAKEFQENYQKPVKDSFFSNQLTALKRFGILEPIPSEAHKKQPRKLQIASFKHLIQSQMIKADDQPRRSLTNIKGHQEASLKHAINTKAVSLSSLPEKLEFAIQDIYLNGLFDPVMVLDEHAKGIKSKEKNVVRHGFPLRIRSLADDDLMRASDQGMARQVFSLCNIVNQRRVEAKLNGALRQGDDSSKTELRKLLSSQVPNLYTLDEIALAKLMGIDHHKIKNRNTAINTFLRISGTRFWVDSSANPIFTNALSWMKLQEDVKEVHFQMHFWTVKQMITANDGLRIFTFAIDDHAFQSMLVRPERPTIYKAPLSLASEKIGLAHIIHNWVRKHGVEQQEKLFEQEFGIDELYRQLSISVDHQHWDELPALEKKRLTATHKKAISAQLTQLHKKHTVGTSWTDDSGSEISKAVFHGVEVLKVVYNSRSRRFRFRVNPYDDVIGSKAKNLHSDSESGSIEPYDGSTWDLTPEEIVEAENKLVIGGLPPSKASDEITQWMILNEEKIWDSKEGILKALVVHIDQINKIKTKKNHKAEACTASSLLMSWEPSAKLIKQLYGEADNQGVSVNQFDFMVMGKVDEFKQRYRENNFISENVIEAQFYNYFLRGLAFEKNKSAAMGSQGYLGADKTPELNGLLEDTSWAHSKSLFSIEEGVGDAGALEGDFSVIDRSDGGDTAV